MHENPHQQKIPAKNLSIPEAINFSHIQRRKGQIRDPIATASDKNDVPKRSSESVERADWNRHIMPSGLVVSSRGAVQRIQHR
jgi:hypothetical protein